MRIVAWPPVGIVSAAPWVERQVARSEGLNTRRAIMASAGPARRVAQLTVSALAQGRAGAGYMDQLWREIDGGLHYVRLDILSPNWHIDRATGRAMGYTRPGNWTYNAETAQWTSGGNAAVWFTASNRPGTPGTSGGYPTITLGSLPPNALIVRPGDLVRSYTVAAGAVTGSAVARAVTEARSDAAGVVTIRLDTTLQAGIISLHDAESVVFEVTGITPGAQGVGADWQYQVSLREVLPTEYAGATEVNPWRM
ncbi:hypothetical protein [Gemmobacter sp.]|uniref:hypothetical protein n=1 Tax=Gemmobacter sp. TaxID=1898957 RepID=UPI002AFF5892|nr:hypothetical protein [Gemmobacter sp.]